MDILIDEEGKWLQSDGNIPEDAVWERGLVHIRRLSRASILVSLRPRLLHPTTMVGAFYAIADLGRIRVFLATTTDQEWDEFADYIPAFRRIERLCSRRSELSFAERLLRGCC